MALKEGDIVKVKKGVLDPDFGNAIGGWQGEVSGVDGDLVCVEWDKITLSECPEKHIQRCEESGLDWEQIYLSVEDIEPAIPRITPAVLNDIKEVIHLKHQWDYLGESTSKRIRKVLKDANITDEDDVMGAWEQYLSNQLSFPFNAEISEYQDRGPLQKGDKIRIHDLIGSDDHYGILVKLRLGKNVYHYPLCIIRVKDKKSSNYKMVNDYSIWFSNR